MHSHLLILFLTINRQLYKSLQFSATPEALIRFADNIYNYELVIVYGKSCILHVTIIGTPEPSRCESHVFISVAFDMQNASSHYKYSSFVTIPINFRTTFTLRHLPIISFLRCLRFSQYLHIILPCRSRLPASKSIPRKSHYRLRRTSLVNLICLLSCTGTINSL